MEIRTQAIDPELSKRIFEYYQDWNTEKIELGNGDFVIYYFLIRENKESPKDIPLLVFLNGSGYPFRYWSSFLKYKPQDDLVKIYINILKYYLIEAVP